MKIEIVSIGYKIVHHWNLILFTILALTGSVLFSIELMGWLAYAVGAPLSAVLGVDPLTAGVQLVRTSHRFIGFVWGALLTVYGLYLLVFRRVEVFKPLKKPIGQQIREAKAIAAHYMLGRPMPKDIEESLDRHNILVSYMALLLFISIVLFGISGVGLVFRDSLGLSSATAGVLLLLHDVAFALGLLFVAMHLFAVTHPSNRPLLNAMFGDGTIELEWAKKHMPKFLSRRGVR
ncbi:Cytochrome b(N-terminal)/b6/petB [Pyrobaculum oguniense TE7]|uniref:Cytochrome b(N-terminal)/b6/petB n=1 Tax=Pyrobaculum oguniense (strain DSM 13380 / JCM 10595 / TE7) TaxID=698757 RepID=H6Q948_PYROT|nr:Cytochrome b(N-terminal)/b6/petB [Pyrobaculum oguniense TE7]